MATGKVLKDYMIGVGLTLSIVGIPLVLGYLSSLMANKIRGSNDEREVVVGSYVPIIDRYISGILFILYTSLPFAMIFFVQGVYAWSLNTEIGSIDLIVSFSSTLAVFLSLFSMYTIPFFATVQSYREAYGRTFDQVLFEFTIPNLTSGNYFKYFFAFFVLSIGYSSFSYAGTLSLIFYFFAILVTPAYIIVTGNLIGNGSYKVAS